MLSFTQVLMTCDTVCQNIKYAHKLQLRFNRVYRFPFHIRFLLQETEKIQRQQQNIDLLWNLTVK